jgi:alpha-galactosidase
VNYYVSTFADASAMNCCILPRKTIAAFLLLMMNAGAVLALTNGLALTPPMGYNSWYANGTNVSDAFLRNIADQMVSTGMRDVGYHYLCLDDGWAGYRDTNGNIVPDPSKFPNGMKPVVDYVHSKGLKFGIYTVFGSNTCAGLPGSYGHVVQDANTYAAWGVDYLKYEGCSFPDPLDHEQEQCELMGNALKSRGRPIAFTMSTGPYQSWFPSDLNMWRGTGDYTGLWQNLLDHINFVSQSAYAAAPGGWNDPDVLNIGNSYLDEQACFSMWCILAAPLLTPVVDNAYTNILCNTEAIAVDQDAAGIQGTCVSSNGALQVWCKPLGSSNGLVKAVALFNTGNATGTITANWSDLGLPSGAAAVRDLWAHEYAGTFTNSYTATLVGHGINFVKISYGTNAPLRRAGTNYLSDLDWLPSTTNPYGIGQDQDSGGNLITLHGVHYAKGLGAHAVSHIQFPLLGATRFHSNIGVDDDACCNTASIIFNVSVDGTNLYNSGVMTSLSATQTIDVNVTGGNILTLDVTNGVAGNVGDHADWAGAYIVMPAMPVVTSTLVNGTNLVLGGINGSAGTQYYVLTSTNSALSPLQWTRIATNNFDVSGNFSASIPLPSGSSFYRLQVP